MRHTFFWVQYTTDEANELITAFKLHLTKFGAFSEYELVKCSLNPGIIRINKTVNDNFAFCEIKELG